MFIHYGSQNTPVWRKCVKNTLFRSTILTFASQDHQDDERHIDEVIDDNTPIAERRQRRTITLPKRYDDFLPEPPSNLPPPTIAATRKFCFFQSPPNIFGLRRRYYSATLPLHDPDKLITLSDLQTSRAISYEPSTTNESYFPYPNRNSFLLGNWYWSGGIQKTQKSFKDLVDIVGALDFEPSDVHNTNWMAIDNYLGSSERDDVEDGEWTDADAGWIKTPINISVPFHNRTARPGPHPYTGGNLYHRSLVDVIREKVSDASTAQNFHMEPYELTWSPHLGSYQIPVHGELYTSPAFIEAHRDLQDQAGELGCNLQRVVVAMMFWSDATHLTSFGNAKLWPLYLFFGNESKYRRSRPSYNLCSHVAYFKEVCVFKNLSSGN